MCARRNKLKFFILLCMLGLVTFIMSGCGLYCSHAYKTDIKSASALTVIALAPVEVPKELPYAYQAQDFFHRAISGKLTSAGLQVITQDVFTQIMLAVAQEKSGAYDPVSGLKNEWKYQELEKAHLKKLQTSTGAHALLRAKVEPVFARFSHCRARWDGTAQNVSWSFLGIICPLSKLHGEIKAFSLLVTLEDFDGNILYFNGGGIQLVTHYVESFPFGAFVQVSKDQLLTDPVRNRAAVDLSLDPLLAAVGRRL